MKKFCFGYHAIKFRNFSRQHHPYLHFDGLPPKSQRSVVSI